MIAYVGGLLVLGAIVAAYCFLAPSLGLLPGQGKPWAVLLPFGLIAMSGAIPLLALPFARLTLRLEPWVGGTL